MQHPDFFQKLEQKDHEITKKQLLDLQLEFDSYKEKIASMFELKISEIKNIHLIEKEHLKNRLQMSEIKCKNLQIQYDELLGQNGVKNEELEEFLFVQQQNNNEIMNKFLQEIGNLRGEVLGSNDKILNLITKTEELNLITESTLQNMRNTITRQNSNVYLKLNNPGDQKFEFQQAHSFDLKKFDNYKDDLDEVFGSTQIDNFDIGENLDSLDFTKRSKKRRSLSRNCLKKRYLSPQPCMENALKSIDFDPYQQEQKPSENQMIFQKLVKVPPVNIENLKQQPAKESSRYEAFRDSNPSPFVTERQVDQRAMRLKKIQARAKARMYENKSVTRLADPASENEISPLKTQIQNLQNVYKTQIQNLKIENQSLRSQLFNLEKQFSKELKSMRENTQKIMTEKQVLEDIIKKHISQNVTLNVTESVSNWSLFNIFGEKKPEVKQYSVKIENEDVVTKSNNFHLYQGNLLEETARPSVIFNESSIKKPVNMELKKNQVSRFQDGSLKVKTFDRKYSEENCETPDLINEQLKIYQSIEINQTEYFTFNKIKKNHSRLKSVVYSESKNLVSDKVSQRSVSHESYKGPKFNTFVTPTLQNTAKKISILVSEDNSCDLSN